MAYLSDPNTAALTAIIGHLMGMLGQRTFVLSEQSLRDNSYTVRIEHDPMRMAWIVDVDPRFRLGISHEKTRGKTVVEADALFDPAVVGPPPLWDGVSAPKPSEMNKLVDETRKLVKANDKQQERLAKAKEQIEDLFARIENLEKRLPAPMKINARPPGAKKRPERRG